MKLKTKFWKIGSSSFKSPFWKYLNTIELKLSGYDRIVIFLFYKKKKPIKKRYLESS